MSTTTDNTPERGPRPSSLPRISTGLHQGEWWRPRSGPPVRIADMDKAWRYNTVRFLERRAKYLADREAWSMVSLPGPSGDMACDAFDRELDDLLTGDPVEWLRGTTLMRALSEGIPWDRPKKLAKLAERARHWSHCPKRLDLTAEKCACPPPRDTYGNGEDGAEI